MTTDTAKERKLWWYETLMALVCSDLDCRQRATLVEVIWMHRQPTIVSAWCHDHWPDEPSLPGGKFAYIATMPGKVGHA